MPLKPNVHQFQTARGPTLDGDGRLCATEVGCYECNELLIGFAIDGRGLELREPRSFRHLNKGARPGVGLDLDLQNSGCHSSWRRP